MNKSAVNRISHSIPDIRNNCREIESSLRDDREIVNGFDGSSFHGESGLGGRRYSSTDPIYDVHGHDDESLGGFRRRDESDDDYYNFLSSRETFRITNRSTDIFLAKAKTKRITTVAPDERNGGGCIGDVSHGSYHGVSTEGSISYLSGGDMNRRSSESVSEFLVEQYKSVIADLESEVETLKMRLSSSEKELQSLKEVASDESGNGLSDNAAKSSGHSCESSKKVLSALPCGCVCQCAKSHGSKSKSDPKLQDDAIMTASQQIAMKKELAAKDERISHLEGKLIEMSMKLAMSRSVQDEYLLKSRMRSSNVSTISNSVNIIASGSNSFNSQNGDQTAAGKNDSTQRGDNVLGFMKSFRRQSGLTQQRSNRETQPQENNTIIEASNHGGTNKDSASNPPRTSSSLFLDKFFSLDREVRADNQIRSVSNVKTVSKGDSRRKSSNGSTTHILIDLDDGSKEGTNEPHPKIDPSQIKERRNSKRRSKKSSSFKQGALGYFSGFRTSWMDTNGLSGELDSHDSDDSDEESTGADKTFEPSNGTDPVTTRANSFDNKRVISGGTHGREKIEDNLSTMSSSLSAIDSEQYNLHKYSRNQHSLASRLSLPTFLDFMNSQQKTSVGVTSAPIRTKNYSSIDIYDEFGDHDDFILKQIYMKKPRKESCGKYSETGISQKQVQAETSPAMSSSLSVLETEQYNLHRYSDDCSKGKSKMQRPLGPKLSMPVFGTFSKIQRSTSEGAANKDNNRMLRRTSAGMDLTPGQDLSCRLSKDISFVGSEGSKPSKPIVEEFFNIQRSTPEGIMHRERDDMPQWISDGMNSRSEVKVSDKMTNDFTRVSPQGMKSNKTLLVDSDDFFELSRDRKQTLPTSNVANSRSINSKGGSKDFIDSNGEQSSDKEYKPRQLEQRRTPSTPTVIVNVMNDRSKNTESMNFVPDRRKVATRDDSMRSVCSDDSLDVKDLSKNQNHRNRSLDKLTDYGKDFGPIESMRRQSLPSRNDDYDDSFYGHSHSWTYEPKRGNYKRRSSDRSFPSATAYSRSVGMFMNEVLLERRNAKKGKDRTKDQPREYYSKVGFKSKSGASHEEETEQLLLSRKSNTERLADSGVNHKTATNATIDDSDESLHKGGKNDDLAFTSVQKKQNNFMSTTISHTYQSTGKNDTASLTDCVVFPTTLDDVLEASMSDLDFKNTKL